MQAKIEPSTAEMIAKLRRVLIAEDFGSLAFTGALLRFTLTLSSWLSARGKQTPWISTQSGAGGPDELARI